MVAMANNMISAIASEIYATMKYWAPSLARTIGKEALEHMVRKGLPFTSAAFGLKEICEVCDSNDQALKKRCVATIISQFIEVAPQFLGVGRNVLKWAGLPDILSIALNQMIGGLDPSLRALPRPVEAIGQGVIDIKNGKYKN